MMAPTPWKVRLDEATAVRGRACVGIDPMPRVLAAWGLDATVEGLETCARGIVEELGPHAAVFKPQSAFFEAFGSRGIAVLERVLEDIREVGALSILDVKRGDIGSSMAGYASAYLDDSSQLRADAITVSPYLGIGSLESMIEKAVLAGRGLYVLARTSNPEGHHIQNARINGRTVAQDIIDRIAKWNPGWGYAVGLVIGATHSDPGCDPTDFNGSILVPGIGAQGGTFSDVKNIFQSSTKLVLPTMSREVIGAGKEELVVRFTRLVDQTAGLT